MQTAAGIRKRKGGLLQVVKAKPQEKGRGRQTAADVGGGGEGGEKGNTHCR